MTQTDKLISLLSLAECSLDDAMRFTDRRGPDCANAIDDAQTRVAEALEILRAQNAELEADIQKQAEAWGL